MAHDAAHGDTFEDTGEVDMSRSGRKVWLVKMPQFIVDAWKHAGPETELGRVKVTQKGANTECTMSLTGPYASNLPKEYRLNLNTAPQPIYAFSEDAHGNVALEGTVKHRGDVGPVDGESAEYRNLVRRRTAEGDAKTRGVQQYNDVQMPVRPAAASRVISTITGKRKDTRRVANEPPEKRERMEEEKLQAIIFERFERRPYYTLKELSDITQQPQLYLKQVLGQLCVYNKRGPNKNTFELKPEYKHRKKDTTEENEADKVAASEAFDAT